MQVMQPAVAPIRDGKHDKNEDEGANELEWGMECGIRSMPRSALEKIETSLRQKSNLLKTCRRADHTFIPLSETEKKGERMRK